MVLPAVLLCVFLSVAIDAKSISPRDGLEPFTLGEYFSGTFGAISFNGNWFSEDTFMHRSAKLDYEIYDLKTKTSTLYLNNTIITSKYTGASITVSPDRQFILIRHSVISVFRHSTTARFAVYNIATEQFYDIADEQQCQIAAWTPSGHGLIYVFENDIYYVAEPDQASKRITVDGVPDVIYNGVPDWVYEEEVLGSGTAFWFSPDGKKLAYAQFNDTEVLEFKYFKYGDSLGNMDQYPTEVDIRYPKVSTKNPDVKTFIADLETGQLSEIKAIPDVFLPEDYVLYDMTWVDNDEVVIMSTNRVQNEGRLVRCYIGGSDCTEEASYKEEEGWLEANIPKYSKDGTKRLEILPRPVPDGDHFYHLVLTDVGSGDETVLTSGRYVVTNVLGWDEENNIIYFLGSFINAPSQRQVYAVTLNLTANTQDLACLTCSMLTTRGPCLYATASFSRDFSYMAKVCQGPGPTVSVVQSTKNAIAGDDSGIIIWQDNSALNEKLASKAIPVVKNLQVPVADGFTANVRLLLPPDLDETIKYPAVVYVYAGPNSNQINDAYSSGFQNYIVTNRKYIYIYIDGRGSGRDGQNKLFQIYRRMGTVEIEDQITVTKWLQDNLPYIDRERTGIWGWSYGGFATAWVLAQDKDHLFKFGLSVAPVTNFALYDTIYTERYMGLDTPEDNEAGYNRTDVTREVEAFRGRNFLLIHGNADDNVHYQQSMHLVRALELADVQFKQQSYPDENHSLGGVSRHLYHTIDRFWARSFNLPDPPYVRSEMTEDKRDDEMLI